MHSSRLPHTKTCWPRAICKNNGMIDGTFRKEAGSLTAAAESKSIFIGTNSIASDEYISIGLSKISSRALEGRHGIGDRG